MDKIKALNISVNGDELRKDAFENLEYHLDASNFKVELKVGEAEFLLNEREVEVFRSAFLYGYWHGAFFILNEISEDATVDKNFTLGEQYEDAKYYCKKSE